MMTSELPNLFDQYSQYENRVTNALLQTLATSPRLARSFLKEFIGIQFNPRRERLILTAQKRPGTHGDRGGTPATETERDTVPDAWLVCEEGDWVVVVESKVERGKVRLDQLRGHLGGIGTNARRYLLVLTPDEQRPREVRILRARHPRVYWHPWSKVHGWTSRALSSENNRAASWHLLRNLKGFLEMDEMLSGFQGIDFRDGYDTRRAKAILKSLMEKIRPGVLRLYPELRGGRGGITIFGMGVWDCFGVEPKFTQDLHITLAIDEIETQISLTVPNSAKQRWWRLRHILEDPVLSIRFQHTLAKLRGGVPELWIRFDQRHYITRQLPVYDARLDFKIDTADFLRPVPDVKVFSLWFKTAQEAILNRGRINLQLMFRARFPYDKVRKIQTPMFVQTALQTVKNFKPLYELLRG